MVEHRLAKARVASSSLVSRSTIQDEGGWMKDESPGGFSVMASFFRLHPLFFQYGDVEIYSGLDFFGVRDC